MTTQCNNANDLRTKLAGIIDREVDGLWEPLDVADAVIRELADECRAGCMWKIPNRYADMTDRQKTILSAQRAIDEHNARDRSHWTEGEQ